MADIGEGNGVEVDSPAEVVGRQRPQQDEADHRCHDNDERRDDVGTPPEDRAVGRAFTVRHGGPSS